MINIVTQLVASEVPYEDLLESEIASFAAKPTYFEGDSRVLKLSAKDGVLIGRFKPTVFSLAQSGVETVDGIDRVRAQLNAVISDYLHRQGVKTATLATKDEYYLMAQEKVAPIEVVVKRYHVGTPKHIYIGMSDCEARDGGRLEAGKAHRAYVRFDWRNPLPSVDACLPDDLADRFIDAAQAKRNAMRAFEVLEGWFATVGIRLLDICFFMNTTGDVICAEVSSDNMRFAYTGTDPRLVALFQETSKRSSLWKAEALLKLLRGLPLNPVRLILSGPFCTGKTTLISRLQDDLQIPKIIDHSTRSMRAKECQGYPYQFISKEEFLENVDKGLYYEWVHFNDAYYGVPKDLIFDARFWTMDTLAASFAAYSETVPGVLGIFLESPGDEELRKRAQERGDAPAAIEQRLQRALEESPAGFDYTLAGDLSVDEKLAIVKGIIFEQI